MGKSKNWGGSSPSTIIEDPKSEVNAFAFLMTSDQVAQMDVWEHVPTNYVRKAVELIDKDGVTFHGEAYFMVSKDFFKFPCEAYLEA